MEVSCYIRLRRKSNASAKGAYDKFLDVASILRAAPTDGRRVICTEMRPPKGIKLSDVTVGSGRVAEKGKIALIHYDCYLPRGDRCASSRSKNAVQLKVGERLTYPAFAYGVPGMRVGGVRSVKVSPNITYYERQLNPQLPPNVALRYEIELLRVADTWDNSIVAEGGSYEQDPPKR